MKPWTAILLCLLFISLTVGVPSHLAARSLAAEKRAWMEERQQIGEAVEAALDSNLQARRMLVEDHKLMAEKESAIWLARREITELKTALGQCNGRRPKR